MSGVGTPSTSRSDNALAASGASAGCAHISTSRSRSSSTSDPGSAMVRTPSPAPFGLGGQQRLLAPRDLLGAQPVQQPASGRGQQPARSGCRGRRRAARCGWPPPPRRRARPRRGRGGGTARGAGPRAGPTPRARPRSVRPRRQGDDVDHGGDLHVVRPAGSPSSSTQHVEVRGLDEVEPAHALDRPRRTGRPSSAAGRRACAGWSRRSASDSASPASSSTPSRAAHASSKARKRPIACHLLLRGVLGPRLHLAVADEEDEVLHEAAPRASTVAPHLDGVPGRGEDLAALEEVVEVLGLDRGRSHPPARRSRRTAPR